MKKWGKNIENNLEEKQQRIQWYIEEFYRITNEYIGREDFQPNANIENQDYDGPHTILQKRLSCEGIDFTEITGFKSFLKRCLSSPDAIAHVYKDQLYHFLIGSTRKPYHDPYTDRLYEDATKRMELFEVFDMEKLSQELAKLS